MRSKSPFIIMKYADDASVTYLTVNCKWSEKTKPGWKANDAHFWNNSGNAWNCIAKLVAAQMEKFEQLFVWSQNGLTPFTEADSISFARILDVTPFPGELDAIASEALKEKSEQIQLLEETLRELQVASNFPNSED